MNTIDHLLLFLLVLKVKAKEPFSCVSMTSWYAKALIVDYETVMFKNNFYTANSYGKKCYKQSDRFYIICTLW